MYISLSPAPAPLHTSPQVGLTSSSGEAYAQVVIGHLGLQDSACPADCNQRGCPAYLCIVLMNINGRIEICSDVEVDVQIWE